MLVKNWMSAPAVTVGPSMSASVALEFMDKNSIRRLPVVETGALVGIVTRSDLQAVLGRGKEQQKGSKKTVGDVMTPGPMTAAPDDTLESAAQLMLKQRISGIPVVKGEKVVGIVTESDLFRAMCKMMGIGETGPRLGIQVKDSEDLLQAIRDKIGNMRVRSLVTMHDARTKQWDVVARVRGRL